MFPADLPDAWRELALQQRDLGAEPQARTLEWCANTLAGSLQDDDEELLNRVQEAADVSGFSADHLGRLVRTGRIRNRGRHGAPRIARGDLRIRSHDENTSVSEADATCDTSNAQIVQSIIERGIE